jgi:hypothetical protein
MKRLLCSCLCFFLCAVFAFAEESREAHSYRISGVHYEITGSTREYPLSLNVPIDQERVFSSEKEFLDYIRVIEQQLINQRMIATAEITRDYLETEAGGVIPVELTIKTKDTINFIAVPYPKFDSNTGLDLRLKLKDYNFFGSMQTLTADVTYQFTEESKHKAGAGAAFDLPFKFSIFDMKWLNDYALSYTFGEKKPEFALTTGIEATVPFKHFNLVITGKQSADLDFDYTEAGDELYFTEDASIAMPLKIADIKNWTTVYLTPDIHGIYNWDNDGITHRDLLSPVVGIGFKLASSRINWDRNYRSGFSFEFGQKFDYNFSPQIDAFTPKIWAETQFFAAYKYLGFNSRIYAFGLEKNTEKIGTRLRGVMDEQDGIDTSFAFVVNLDLPVKVLQTHWRDWGKRAFKKDMPGFFDYLDFELQLSPFVDIAFSHIAVNGVDRAFSGEDGWYAAGLEALVFPNNWRSLYVRFSLGADLARTFDFIGNKVDMSWRQDVSKYELFIGIGLLY